MKLVIISDTHGHHKHLTGKLPSGDVLIHCGDVSGISNEKSVENFSVWFEQQPFEHKICIAGNHDKHMSDKWFQTAIYLEDSSTTLDGLVFYGSPWTPTFFDWYWMKDRGPDIAERWKRIPANTDVLITHGPPSGLGAMSAARGNGGVIEDVGCADLRDAVELVQPRVHCFGHIHEGFGSVQEDEIFFVNASYINPRFSPVEIEI